MTPEWKAEARKIRKETLDAAITCVTQDRTATHGDPENNFGDIAELWSAYLARSIAPKDVASMMILMKVARIKHNPKHRDSWVDIAGYAACGAGLIESQPSLS